MKQHPKITEVFKKTITENFDKDKKDIKLKMATVYTNVKNNTGIFYNDNTLSLLKLATG